MRSFSERLARYLASRPPPIAVLYLRGGTFYRFAHVAWDVKFVFDGNRGCYFDRLHPISDRFDERVRP